MRVALLSVFFGLGVLADKLYRDYPHLIIPLDAQLPDKEYGTVPSFHISNGNFTAANWDVPNNEATRCQLGFIIDTDVTRGAPWSLWGVGDDEAYLVNILELPNDSIKPNTTFNSSPKTGVIVALLAVKKSGETTLTMLTELVCQKGQVASFLLQPADPVRQWNGGLSWYELDYPHGITYDMYLPDWAPLA